MTRWNSVTPTEKQIEKSILDALNYMPGCWAMKINNAGIQRIEDRFIKVGVKGVPDIMGYYKGKFLAIEVKRPGKKATPEQKEFIIKANQDNCIAFVADNLDYVKSYLHEYDQNHLCLIEKLVPKVGR
jgi:penicillin-binding protein-related factor A (putative recombinase)